jgi:hypothetical protein
MTRKCASAKTTTKISMSSAVYISDVLSSIRELFREDGFGPGQKMPTKTIHLKLLRVSGEDSAAALQLGIDQDILQLFDGGGPAGLDSVALTDKGNLL